MNNTVKWDGRGKGSPLGMRIFITIIAWCGVFPAYALLSVVACWYALRDKQGAAAFRAFRSNAGFTHTGFLHIYRHFYAFGMALIDRVAFVALTKPPFTYSLINEDFITGILEKKKGVILVSGHIGTWEIAGNLLSDRLDADIYAVLLDNEKQELKEAFGRVTGQRRFHTIAVEKEAVAMMIRIQEALRNNGILCLLADRVTGSAQIKMPFLGKEAVFPLGPFQIAAITGTPVVPCFIVKDGLTHFTLKAYSPILFEKVTRQNRDESVISAIKQFVSIIEEVAKSHPYQWFNFFNFWDE